jgi:adenylate cyclase
MTGLDNERPESLTDLKLCFEGVIPAVVATTAADGTPNVTYLSKVRMVDEERVALSNQFFSKTSRNLAEIPRASLLLVDPVSYRQYRLALAYERTERRGRVFELLHEDVAAVAAMQGMQDVFKLRGADIYRVLFVEVVPGRGSIRSDLAV